MKKYSLLLLIFVLTFLTGCSALNSLFNSTPSERKPLRVGVNHAFLVSMDFSNHLVTTENMGEDTDYISTSITTPNFSFIGWIDESGMSFDQLSTPNFNTSKIYFCGFASLIDCIDSIGSTSSQDVYLIYTKEKHYAKMRFALNPQLVTENLEMYTDLINSGERILMVWVYNPNGELYFQEKQIELFKDGVSLGVTDNTNLTECVQYILEKYQ